MCFPLCLIIATLTLLMVDLSGNTLSCVTFSHVEYLNTFFIVQSPDVVESVIVPSQFISFVWLPPVLYQANCGVFSNS